MQFIECTCRTPYGVPALGGLGFVRPTQPHGVIDGYTHGHGIAAEWKYDILRRSDEQLTVS